MKRKHAEELLLQIHFRMKNENDPLRRHHLWELASSLVLKYKDLKYKEIKKRLGKEGTATLVKSNN